MTGPRLDVYSDEFRDLILTSATHRAHGRYADAIATIEPRLTDFADSCLMNAYLEIIQASEAAGDLSTARNYARKLEAIDPTIPIVRRLLSNR